VRIGIIAQNIPEWLALATGKVPEPIVEAFPPLVLARSIMAATKLGIFDALVDHALTGDEVAAACATDPRATAALLGVLASAGYLDERKGTYRLGGKAQRWLRHGDPADVSAYIRFNYLQWDWLGELERFIQSGTPIDFHQRLTSAEWEDYERGMAAIARLTLPEVVWRTPIPPDATALLDIGGGHGLASARFLRRHPQMRATVLDLPQALAGAPPLPAEIAKRIERTPGDALTADLGHRAYDVIYVANLLHHFDASQNASLARRVAAALRPGGIWVIQDGVRERRRRSERMPAAIGDLYFALTSASGFWSFAEMAAWQRQAGLRPMRSIRLLTAPGQGLQIATKPREREGQ
jgi:O-methyltransferase/methyltransferase family protein